MLLCESNRAVQQNKTLMIIEMYIPESFGSDNRVYTTVCILLYWTLSHLFDNDKQSHILLLHCC